MNARTRTGLTTLFILGAAAALMFFAVLVAVSPGPRRASAGAHPGGTLSPEEGAIRQYVLDNATAPETITFEKWGPHLTPAEVAGWAGKPESEATRQGVRAMYRAVYQGRAKSGQFERRDVIFDVDRGLASPLYANAAGDGWKEAQRRKAVGR